MTKLVFDIETIGKGWKELDELTQEYFIEKFENKEVAEQNFALMPSVGQVVAVGLYNPVTKNGGVLLVVELSDDEKENLKSIFNFDVQFFCSEKELLQKFWEIATSYREFITFAGNLFDVPFLMFRSAVNQIRPSINLYKKDYHVDLLDKFRSLHPHKNPSLHLLSQAFGLDSPKKVVNGKIASNFYREGKLKEFIEYAYGDALTTAKIYGIWSEYLKFA